MKRSFYLLNAGLILQLLPVALFFFPMFMNAPSSALVFTGIVMLLLSITIAAIGATGIVKAQTRLKGSAAARSIVSYLRCRTWKTTDLDLIQAQINIERDVADKEI